MSSPTIEQDIAAISRVSAVPHILKIVSELTGMRLTLIARVTVDSWTACAVNDQMNFGLLVGSKLDVTTTLCSEVRASMTPIVIANVSTDPVYCMHRTPKLYNLGSYIAVPLFRSSGEYFGNLCALDREAAQLPPTVLQSLHLFTDLISRQVASEEEAQSITRAYLENRRTTAAQDQFLNAAGESLRIRTSAISAALDDLPRLPAETPKQASARRALVEATADILKLADRMQGLARASVLTERRRNVTNRNVTP